MSEKEVKRLVGVLEEWHREDIIVALEEMKIETPKTTIGVDTAEIAKEKLKAVVATLESSRFNRVMRKIDTSKEVRDEAKKDVIGYLKNEGIQFPEGVDIEVIIQEEVKAAKPKHIEIHLHIHLHAI